MDRFHHAPWPAGIDAGFLSRAGLQESGKRRSDDPALAERTVLCRVENLYPQALEILAQDEVGGCDRGLRRAAGLHGVRRRAA